MTLLIIMRRRRFQPFVPWFRRQRLLLNRRVIVSRTRGRRQKWGGRLVSIWFQQFFRFVVPVKFRVGLASRPLLFSRPLLPRRMMWWGRGRWWASRFARRIKPLMSRPRKSSNPTKTGRRNRPVIFCPRLPSGWFRVQLPSGRWSWFISVFLKNFSFRRGRGP